MGVPVAKLSRKYVCKAVSAAKSCAVTLGTTKTDPINDTKPRVNPSAAVQANPEKTFLVVAMRAANKQLRTITASRQRLVSAPEPDENNSRKYPAEETTA